MRAKATAKHARLPSYQAGTLACTYYTLSATFIHASTASAWATQWHHSKDNNSTCFAGAAQLPSCAKPRLTAGAPGQVLDTGVGAQDEHGLHAAARARVAQHQRGRLGRIPDHLCVPSAVPQTQPCMRRQMQSQTTELHLDGALRDVISAGRRGCCRRTRHARLVGGEAQRAAGRVADQRFAQAAHQLHIRQVGVA